MKTVRPANGDRTSTHPSGYPDDAGHLFRVRRDVVSDLAELPYVTRDVEIVGRDSMSGIRTINRPEVQLLLCCAQTTQDPVREDRIGALLRREIDWTYLLVTASRHGVAPLLYRSLNAADTKGVPQDVLELLRERIYANSRRNLFLSGKLLEILDALEEREISALPYKGPVLATAAYGNLGLREFSDLDLLLDDEDVLEAREVLASLGYQPRDRMTGAQGAAFLRYERQYEFAHDDGTMVELQWRVTPRYFSFPLDHEYVLERSVPVALGGRTVQTFSPEDLLLVLCVHGSVHCWSRLGWVCDIAELVRTSGEMDWERLVERAGTFGGRRMLLLGLFLANHLLGLELEPYIVRQARSDKTVEALAKDVCERLLSEVPDPQGILEGSAFRSFHFRVIEGSRGKLRYCAHRVATPTLWERRLVPLPAVLFPFYRVLRPILLIGKFGSRLAKRALLDHGESRVSR